MKARGMGFNYEEINKTSNNNNLVSPKVTGTLYYNELVDRYRLMSMTDLKEIEHYYIVKKELYDEYPRSFKLTEVESGVVIYRGELTIEKGPSLESLDDYLITYEVLKQEYSYQDIVDLINHIREDKKNKTLVKKSRDKD